MNAKPLPSANTLHKILRYDHEEGILFWRERTADIALLLGVSTSSRSVRSWNSKHAGLPAGYRQREGYYSVAISGQRYRAHRLAWALYYGEQPKGEIDHINGNPSDNRICNLRDVSHSVNGLNQRTQVNNSSGAIGVFWNSIRQKWQAEICFQGRRIYLGRFSEFSDAASARKSAELHYGFHDNHGRISHA